MAAESKEQAFELESLKTRLAAMKTELGEAKKDKEEAEKREEEWKGKAEAKEISEGTAAKQLAEVRRWKGVGVQQLSLSYEDS